jgi:hypothetical protein
VGKHLSHLLDVEVSIESTGDETRLQLWGPSDMVDEFAVKYFATYPVRRYRTRICQEAVFVENGYKCLGITRKGTSISAFQNRRAF